MYEIFLGSSKVFIGGMRAARMGDICKACMPGMAGMVRGAAAAMAAAGQVVALTGVIADAAEAGAASDPHMASAQAMSAAMGAAQMAADAATMAVMAAMGTDPAIPPSPGALVIGIPNVLIGGFPMINFPDPAQMLFGKLGRKKKQKKQKKQNNGCDGIGHPVDIVTGAAFDDIEDFSLPGPLPLTWTRHYQSNRRTDRGSLGRGFRHSFERTLKPDLDGFQFTDQRGEVSYLPHILPGETEVAHNGLLLRKLEGQRFLVKVPNEPEMVFAADRPDAPARLVALQTDEGRVGLRYNGNGWLDRIDGSLGQTLRLFYNEWGLLTEVRLMGQEWGAEHSLQRYGYDEWGCLVQALDEEGHEATYAYDDLRRMTRTTDRRGYSFFYEYDNEDRCVHSYGQDGLYEVFLEYLPLERTTIVKTPDGGEWSYFFNENGTILNIIDSYGGVYERKVDDQGRLVEEIDPNKNVTKIVYNRDGGAIYKVDPIGNALTLDGEHFDGAKSFEKPLLETPIGWIDGSLLNPLEIGRFDVSDPVLPLLPPGAAEQLGLQLDEDVRKQPTPSVRERDEAGREIIKHRLNGFIDRITYDTRGHILQRIDEQGRTEQWKYDANENLTQYQDGDGSLFRQEYDSWNLITRQIDPLGNVTAFGYSSRLEVNEVVDPGGSAHHYEYDKNDRLVAISRDGILYEGYEYDLADNPLRKIGKDGEVLLSLEYGHGNLPIQRKLSSGEVQSFAYDTRGRITRMTSDAYDIELEPTDSFLLRKDLCNGKGVRHRVRGAHLEESIYFERFAVRYEKQEEGQWLISDPLGNQHLFTTSKSGLVARKLANGISLINRYDARGLCLASLATGEGQSWRRNYRYSRDGDLLRVVDEDEGVYMYQYDKAHRLQREHRPDGTRQEYMHDVAGNLIEKPGLSGVRLAGSNQLAYANGTQFAYNDRAHIASRINGRSTISYAYDSLDMLVRIEGLDAEWGAHYDPLGRRISKQWGDLEWLYYWDGDRLAAEMNPTGQLRLYLYSDPEALVPFMFIDYDGEGAEPSTGKAYYLFCNQIGVPIRVVNEDGELVWHGRVDPYGAVYVVHGHGFHQPLRFPGHYWDEETGLHYNRYRYYSPELGRYLQCDPLDTSGGVNLYAYPSNPLVQVDLQGLRCAIGKVRDFVSGVKSRVKSKLKRVGRALGVLPEAPPKKANLDEFAPKRSAEQAAEECGMNPDHVRNLSERTADNGEMSVIRASNPESLKHQANDDMVAKPVTEKRKTAKDGEHAGKVVDSEGKPVKIDGKEVHGDYDMQGVYKKNEDGTFDKVDTDPTPFVNGMNDDVTPDKPMFQHGANDNYYKRDADGNIMRDDAGNPIMGRNPEPDERFLVSDPDGNLRVVDGTENLKKFYDEHPGMDWPYTVPPY